MSNVYRENVFYGVVVGNLNILKSPTAYINGDNSDFRGLWLERIFVDSLDFNDQLRWSFSFCFSGSHLKSLPGDRAFPGSPSTRCSQKQSSTVDTTASFYCESGEFWEIHARVCILSHSLVNYLITWQSNTCY
jgi:hypothetical protein